mmetsp:Transcript_28843/g.82935  ORF Transcript_28843/g.82935 Transcript_28843/m.82935 type:complete len:239 (-) Transcript_28843:25-741(-)
MQHAGLRRGLRARGLVRLVAMLQGLRQGHQCAAARNQGPGAGRGHMPEGRRQGALRRKAVQHLRLPQPEVHVQGGCDPAPGRQQQHWRGGLERHQDLHQQVPVRLRGERHGRAGLGDRLQRAQDVVRVPPVRWHCFRGGQQHQHEGHLRHQHCPALHPEHRRCQGGDGHDRVAQGEHTHICGAQDGRGRGQAQPRGRALGRGCRHRWPSLEPQDDRAGLPGPQAVREAAVRPCRPAAG